MTYYSNLNQIRELVEQTVDLKVHPLRDLDALPEAKVDLFLFAHLFEPGDNIPDWAWPFDRLMRCRPDWGGTIMEMMKRNDKVYLFCGEWCQVVYSGNPFNHFRFIPCRDPTLDADRSCLIATDDLMGTMRNAIRDLFEPLRFARDLSRRVTELDNSPRVKELLRFNRGDYRETCLKLEEVFGEVLRQRDLWKDRFFVRATEAEQDDLCMDCKESMRETFYMKGDEEEALKWRPGKRDCWRSCKYYDMDSFEEVNSEEYIKDIKNNEYVEYDSD